jgi:hypothetical protein
MRARQASLEGIVLILVLSGCGQSHDTPDADAAALDAFSDTSSADTSPDSSDPPDTASDAEPFDTGVDPWASCVDDEALPGFRARPDGLFTPCRCFDGDPLRPVPDLSVGGIRSVDFSCDWPDGTVFHPRLVAGSYEESFFIVEDALPEGLRIEDICIPRSCVFDTPGERARCGSECATRRLPGDLVFVTTYSVDRAACE